MAKPIRTIEEFFAHALAIEHEAAQRYREFQAHFAERGEEAIAGLCGNLAALEQEHYEFLLRRCSEFTLPPIDDHGYHWLEADSPEAPAGEFVYRVATPRQLMEIAFKAECAARSFFESVAQTAADAKVRAMAAEMAGEEEEHMHWIADAIEYMPTQDIDWDRVLARGKGPRLAPGGERRSRRDRGSGH